jgi:hypothetical protein
MQITDLLNWSVGAGGVLGTIYTVWAAKKSKGIVKAEEDEGMLENADKIVTMWEKLSANYITELKELKDEYKTVTKQYNDLRVEFEVEKNKSTFLIEQYKLQIAQKDAEIAMLKADNDNMRVMIAELQPGLIKQMNVK